MPDETIDPAPTPKPAKMGFEHAAELEQVRLGELLWDAHTAATRLLEFTAGRSEEDYEVNELLRSVVKTLLDLFADRLQQLQTSYPREFNRIPEAHRLIAVAAPETSPEALWQAATTAVPEALLELRNVLEEWHSA